MQAQNDITNYTNNIRYYAGEIKKLLRKQFDNDVEECDLAQNTANEYLRDLSQLSSLAEGIEFRCDCIAQWLPDIAKKRPAPLNKQIELV